MKRMKRLENKNVSIYFLKQMTIPIITKSYLIAVGILFILVQLQVFNQLTIMFKYSYVFKKMQFYRILTSYLYFGSLSIDVLFHLYFMIRYLTSLEQMLNSIEILYMLMIGTSSITLLNCFVDFPFLSFSLSFMIIYVWSRLNASLLFSFFGLFTFYASYYPIILISISFILQNHVPYHDLMGLLVGHVYWFGNHVYPRLQTNQGTSRKLDLFRKCIV
eukprot:NODE_151_length_15465_cov_0.405376.p8 type:complete len:218 gc:universal NODE_151_length_15465_cov_0.405376:10562-11215(+)